ncbi:MAG TPA: CbiX/SirB N-terminal domain-containing protein, partial [Methanocella sp.]|nr:CbiX/SirB N-terminal domain-containing protein [Methanocella sp.]
MSDALLLVGHGSRSGQADDVLPYYVEFFKGSGDFEEVLACYLEKEPSVRGILSRIKAGRVFVMPLFVAH